MGIFWVALCILLLIVLISVATKMSRAIRKTRPSVRVGNLHKVAHTGDLLLFSFCEKNVVPSWFRKGMFGCEMTHVGILYFRDGVPYVWEANMGEDKVTDALTGEEGVSGTQLIRLDERIAKYRGYCVVRCLRPTVAKLVGKERMERTFRDLFANKLEFCRSKIWIGFMAVSELFGLSRWYPEDDNEKDTTCSELVGRTYSALGLYDEVGEVKPFSLMMPQHFERAKTVGIHQVIAEYELTS